MKKTVSSFTLFLMLFTLSIVGVQPIFASTASEDKVLAGQLNIASPANVTYNTNVLMLNVTSSFILGPEHVKMCYSIDGQNNITIPVTGTREPKPIEITYENGTAEIVNSTKYSFFDLNGKATLSDLCEGTHHLVVYTNYTMNSIIDYDGKEIYFTINTDSQTSSIPEFPSWIILPISLITILFTVTIRKEATKLVKTTSNNPPDTK